MYTPASFAETDQNTLHEFIEQHSFATIVSRSGEGIVASHLPLLLDRNAGPHGRIVGHMARANPQWKQAQDEDVLVIFTGPHAYISPSWYQAINVVPTWNYTAVHAYGTVRLETDRTRLLNIVRRYVDHYEAGLPEPWSLDRAEPEFVDGLLDAIVGFTIDIESIEGKWKLNQNHDADRRSKVATALRIAGGDAQLQVAELIQRSLGETV
ncbi:MAG: FMN-binding negative transcriptional regulator [Planctomycetota bacterium]|nr:FMN-binding negative transcriptional regulator [Planctomycetota bacterium]